MSINNIRFVGHHDFTSEGKFLWEIVCQLRNMGTGRYVTKNEWLTKWPNEPSYLKIVKARPGMDRWMRTGKLWAEWTFRAKNLGIYEFTHDLSRSDWKLIHKHEESQFLQNKSALKEMHMPDSFPLPPLQVLLAKKYAAKNGQTWDPKRERAPLELCVDPQFELLKSFIQQKTPSKTSTSIYEEVEKETLLDLYGNVLPIKIDAWNIGPAEYKRQFDHPEA